MLDSTLTRTATVTADDSRGYWLVSADGIAGIWHACSRTLEVAVGLATCASMIGESLRGEWDVDSGDAPYSLEYGYFESARDAFVIAERVYGARIDGTLLDDAPLCDDLTDAEWSELETTDLIVRADGSRVIESNIGLAHTVLPGHTYVETDGSIIEINI